MNKISELYNQLLDEGVSPIQLYVYSLLLNDERTFHYTDDELNSIIRKVCEKYAMVGAGYGVNLEDIIEQILDGDDIVWEEF